MNVRILGFLVLGIAAVFLLMTGYDMTADQEFIIWAGAIGFFLYAIRLMWKQMEINSYSELLNREINSEMVDDAQFDFYLNQKAWARKRFGRVTWVTFGMALGLMAVG